MGSSQSVVRKPQNAVFESELRKLNELINKVLTSDDKFVDSNYNFLFEDTCNKYTILWEKDLKKHMKVHLQDLEGAIYLIPKKDYVVTSESTIMQGNDAQTHVNSVSKHDLCNKISKHYIKILYILSLVKHVYDIESHGDNSLAGIIDRNIHIDDLSFDISYCSIPHKNYDIQHADKIDFSLLEGLQMFTQHFLSPSEKYMFIEQLRRIFARKPRHQIQDIVCNDTLLSINDYDKIYKRKFEGKGLHCTSKKEKVVVKSVVRTRKNLDLMFEISADNPILHTKYCFSRKRLSVSLKNKNEGVKKLLLLYKELKTHYMDNIEEVVKHLNRIVHVGTDDKYTLKDINTNELTNLIQDVKKTIAKFYVQSIVDYQVLLDYAKEISKNTQT
jgi:hypothetical protein